MDRSRFGEFSVFGSSVWLGLGFVVIIGEAGVTAYETILLLKLAKYLGSVSEALAFASILLFLAVLKLILSTTISALRELWRVEIVEKTLRISSSNLEARPDLYKESALRIETPQAALTTGQLASENIASFVFETGRSVLQYLSLFVAFTLAVSTELVPAFAVSFVVLLALNVYAAKHVRVLSRREEEARVAVGTRFLGVWEGLVVGNLPWRAVWWRRFAQTFRTYKQRNVHHLLVVFSTSVAGFLVSYGIVGTTYLHMFRSQADETGTLIGLMATVPKLVQMLHAQLTLVSYVLALGALGGQFEILRKALAKPARIDLLARTDLAALRIDGRPANEGIGSFLTSVGQGAACRARVEGRNGAGKTSLLLHIKEELGDDALYVGPPADDAHGVGRGSTGQRHLRWLHSALSRFDQRVLLLDEWSAHLDETNAKDLDQRIAEFVERGGAVLETRHH